MIVAALLLGLASFVAVLRYSGVVAIGLSAAGTARDAAGAMRDRTLSDDEKERRVQRASLDLFKRFAQIAGIGVLAFAAPALVVWLGSAVGLYPFADAMAVAQGWPFIIAATILAGLAFVAERRPHKDAAPAASAQSYGRRDRALHRIAFSTAQAQKGLADMENRMYRRDYDLATAERPVFVTSLPRAGTTLMLEVLATLPEFASATYRHMPFTMTPLMWQRFEGLFRREAAQAERAHGDGLSVGVDSPEAFEEMFWMAFWPDQYRPAAIDLWPDRIDPEFEAAFRHHRAKVVAASGKPLARRYLSKNNANIARLAHLRALCPDATLVIPVRDPFAQVASLMRQHIQFTERHATDPFALRYMNGVGHFEFGAALRPIAFDNVTRDPAQAGDAAFWLSYWADAYETVLATVGSDAVFVDHDALSEAPRTHLKLLAERLGVADTEVLTRQAPRFRPQHPGSAPKAPDALLARSVAIHDALLARCLRPAVPIGKAS